MSERFLSPRVTAVPPSGIRRFFDIAGTMKDAVSLGVGEPDFVTPYHIRNAAMDSLLSGETQYTPNRGLLSLRREIAGYLRNRVNVEYDPETEIVVTVGASEAIDLALRATVEPGEQFAKNKAGTSDCFGKPDPVDQFFAFHAAREDWYDLSITLSGRSFTYGCSSLCLC